MDAGRVHTGFAHGQPQGLGGSLQLPIDIRPLANTKEVEVLRLAQSAELVARELLLLRFEIVPEVQEREEVARRVSEAGMSGVGLRALLEGTFARILDAEPRDDRHDLPRGAVLLRLDDHAGEPRVEGQLGELSADGSDLEFAR